MTLTEPEKQLLRLLVDMADAGLAEFQEEREAAWDMVYRAEQKEIEVSDEKFMYLIGAVCAVLIGGIGGWIIRGLV